MPVTRKPSDRLTLSRRRVLAAATASSAIVGLSRQSLTLAALVPTPRQTQGPFYPKSLPLDPGNDLVRISGHERQASGTVTHILGRVLDNDGHPIPEASIEIWQCDSHGRYHYVDDRAAPPLDPDFKGYGRTVSAADGSYRFRTIRPVPYPGRTPHIHFAIITPQRRKLVTQMYVAGEPLNERDPILAQIRDPGMRDRVVVPLQPAPQVEPEALAGTFDIVFSG